MKRAHAALTAYELGSTDKLIDPFHIMEINLNATTFLTTVEAVALTAAEAVDSPTLAGAPRAHTARRDRCLCWFSVFLVAPHDIAIMYASNAHTDRHTQRHTETHRYTHRERHTRRHTHRLKQRQVNTSKDGPQARGWAIRHPRQVARCREPKQNLNLYSPVEAPRRCRGLGKQPVVPKQVVSVATVCEGLDCKSRASCEAGCDRFR